MYDTPPMRYDSVTPERDLLKRDYDDEVTVFGKIPKRAIQVPKYTGGTTTPDFVYMVEREDKSHVYLLVETKADNKRISDQQIVDIQTEFFRQLEQQNVVYTEATDAQTVISKLRTLENEKGGN
ncbi:type III restriction-modification system enzyme, R subunit [Weissella confusa]|uniref:restriction endonuclease n=1 Tax=Weissella confusa TaxID=1583 RepID=UPI0007142C85|nr:type III restriction-modification system enzyme, R subunit [Weissella confusa]